MPDEMLYDFGDFRLDAGRRLLSHRSQGAVPITSRAFDTLLHLVRNAGRLVPKRELMDAVWGDAVVEENNLTQTISTLRQLLGERPDEHRYIVTVSGRGYRFIATVESGTPASTASAATPAPARSNRRTVIAVALAGVAVAIGIATLFSGRFATQPQIESIAVLPFKPLVRESGDPALELGMADTLIERLGNSGGLVVRPLSSVRKYAPLEQDALVAGRELGVDAVLEGSIQRNGEMLRITTRLLRVSDGAAIWSNQVDQAWTNLFDVQDRLAEQVAAALSLRLSKEERQQLTYRHTENPEAYRAYLLGRYHFLKLTPPEIDKSIGYFKRAIDHDLRYALAYEGLAEAYRAMTITSDRRPSEVMPQGKTAATRALAFDARLDSAWASMCFIQIWWDWDWRAAEHACKRAIEINPNGADGHRAYAVLLSDLGRHEQAIAEARRASELDPLALITNAIEGHVLHYAGRDAEAETKLRATLELDDNFWIAHLFLGKVHLARNELQQALTEFEKARALSGGNSEAVSMVGYTQAKLGDRKGAEAALAELRERSAVRYVPPFNVAMIYNGLGDADNTFAWLEKAYADRDVRLTFLKIEHKWDPLRADERFVWLAQRMKLLDGPQLPEPIRLDLTFVQSIPVTRITVGGRDVEAVVDISGGDADGALTLTHEAIQNAGGRSLGTAVANDAFGHEFTRPRYQVSDVMIGGHAFQNMRVVEAVVDATAEGPPVPNAIGKHFLSRYFVVVDFAGASVTLWPPDTRNPRGTDCGRTRIPMERVKEEQLAVSVFDTPSGRVRLLWGTGNSYSMLPETTAEKLRVATVTHGPKSPKFYEPQTLSAAGQDLGPLGFVVLPLKLPSDFEGMLGGNFFEHHVVCFDYERREIRVR